MTGERDGDGFGSAVAGHVGAARACCWSSVHRVPGASRTGRTYVYTDRSAKPAFVIDADDTGGGAWRRCSSRSRGTSMRTAPGLRVRLGFRQSREGPVHWPHLRALGQGRPPPAAADRRRPGRGLRDQSLLRGRSSTGDGHADLAVGAWQHAGSRPCPAGASTCYSGKDGRLLRTITSRGSPATPSASTQSASVMSMATGPDRPAGDGRLHGGINGYRVWTLCFSALERRSNADVG